MLNILTLYYRGLARSTEREKGKKMYFMKLWLKASQTEEGNIFRYRNHRESPIRYTQRCTKIHTNTYQNQNGKRQRKNVKKELAPKCLGPYGL